MLCSRASHKTTTNFGVSHSSVELWARTTGFDDPLGLRGLTVWAMRMGWDAHGLRERVGWWRRVFGLFGSWHGSWPVGHGWRACLHRRRCERRRELLARVRTPRAGRGRVGARGRASSVMDEEDDLVHRYGAF